MDSQKTQTLLVTWRATLSEKEKALHELAAVKLKKSLDFPGDGDNGSYFPEKCHAFRKWLKAQKA
jgi:hypothetical protein